MAGSGKAHLRPDDQTLVRIENLVVEFPVGNTGLKVHAVSDISLDIGEGETLGLVGESGCGKTTAGRAMMQVPPPTSGDVLLEGHDLTGFGSEDIRRTRSKMQMIFQDPISSLNPRRTIREIVAEPLIIQWLEGDIGRTGAARVWERYVRWLMPIWVRLWSVLRYVLAVLGVGIVAWIVGESAGWGWLRDLSTVIWGPALVVVAPVVAFVALTALGWLLLVLVIPIMAGPRALKRRRRRQEFWDRAEAQVREVLSTVGLDPDVAMDKRPHEFSGGQAQRICIARALILDPKVLICDEPVSALDVSVQAQILNLLESMKRTYGLTMVFISHDLAVVKNVSDRVAVMYLGKLCEVAPPDELYARPAHPYSGALISAIPVPNPMIDQRQIGAIEGEIPSPVDPPSGCRFRTRCPRATDLCVEAEPEVQSIGPDHYVACHHPVLDGEVDASLDGQAAGVGVGSP